MPFILFIFNLDQRFSCQHLTIRVELVNILINAFLNFLFAGVEPPTPAGSIPATSTKVSETSLSETGKLNPGA